MTDQIHSFKKELDNIPVPFDKLDAIIAQTVQQTARNRKATGRKKALYKTGAAAAVVAGLLFGSAAVSPAMASIVSQIPLIGSIFSQFGDAGLKQVSEQGLTTVLGESQTAGGTSLTINEVFYDGTRLSVGYSLESDTEQPLGDAYTMIRADLSIDGKSIGFSGSDKQTEITPADRTGILDIDPSADLPDQFNMGLTFHAEDNKQWKFSIPVSVQAGTKQVAIDHRQQAGGLELTVTEIKFGPAGALLTFRAVSDETDDVANYLEFKMVDGAGKELNSHSGGTKGETRDGKNFFTGTRLFDPLGVDVSTLTITPYAVFPSKGGGVAMDAQGKETPLEFTPNTGTGKDIEFNSFTVTLP